MVVLDVLSAIGSLASIAGEARFHFEKNKNQQVVTPPDYSQIPTDLERNAEAVDQFISCRVGTNIITEEEKQQVYDEFYRRYPEFCYDHVFTDNLIEQAINQLETYLQEKMTPGERVIKSNIDELKSQVLSLTEKVDNIKIGPNVNITQNYIHQMINHVDIKTQPIVLGISRPIEITVANLQLAALGKSIDYTSISLSVTSSAEDKFHMESVGDDHGLSFVIDYSAIDNKMTLNYRFSSKSVADLLKNAEFVRNVVETGSFAFYHDGDIVMGPLPAKLLFDYTVDEANKVRQFALDLLLIEAFYDIEVNTEKDFDQDDQEWVGILAESIRGRSVPYKWSNASFTGIIHTAREGMSIKDTLEETFDNLKYGYTVIGDLTIGATDVGEIKVKYELDSARVNNLQEIQDVLDKNPHKEDIPVTIKLIPGDSDRGTRKVIFDC